MRVITGKAKGRRLYRCRATAPGPSRTAPRRRCSVSRGLDHRQRVLDLSGARAASASRREPGCSFAHFIDANRKAVETIETNLRLCRFTEQPRVERGRQPSVPRALCGYAVRSHLRCPAAIPGAMARKP